MRPKVPKAAQATDEDLEKDAVAEELEQQTGRPADPRVVEARIQSAAVAELGRNKRPGLNYQDRAHLIQALTDGVEFKDGRRVVMDWDAAVAAVAQDIQPGALEGNRKEILATAAEIMRKRGLAEEHNALVAKQAAVSAALAGGQRAGYRRTGMTLNELREIVRLMRRRMSFEDAVAFVIPDQIDPAVIEGHKAEILRQVAEGDKPHSPR